MKKNCTVFCAALLALLLLCGCSGITKDGYKRFRSTPIGVAVEYPLDWDVASDNKEGSVVFASPSIGLADAFRENVSIVSDELAQSDGAFDVYVQEYVESLRGSVGQYQFISEATVNVAGVSAHRVIYEGSSDARTLRFQQTLIPSGKYVFIYTYIAQPADYDYFEAISDRMIGTLRLLKS